MERIDIYNKKVQYIIRVILVFLAVAFNSRWFSTQMPEKKYMYIVAIIIGLFAGIRPRNIFDFVK
jgi:hypothetical protein